MDNWKAPEYDPNTTIYGGIDCKAIIDCFSTGSIQSIRVEDKKIYVYITEDDNWYANKCIMRSWYFDYDKFETSEYEFDCYDYGVYVFWAKT